MAYTMQALNLFKKKVTIFKRVDTGEIYVCTNPVAIVEHASPKISNWIDLEGYKVQSQCTEDHWDSAA
jgi:hypothetical protein